MIIKNKMKIKEQRSKMYSAGLIFFLVGISLFFVSSVYAQESTVCCAETTSGALCQNVPASECAAGSQQVPTACDSTSFCKAGTCYDSSEGTCLDNTPQLVCNENGGVWSEESPPQCALGCCVLGDQAAFVSLVRCKKLSADLGLQTNYKSDVASEVACIASVQGQEKGACVFEFEFEKTCKFTTRAECEGKTESLNGTATEGTFYRDKLCSAEELGTVCGQTTETTCVAGKDEVYFVDTCGNPANVYDASKINDQEYWTNVKTKDESCNPSSGNALSKSCGNCNYLQGSYCRTEDTAKASPTYGDFICGNLNCPNGRKHGESWCVYDDAGSTGQGASTVGSRFYKHICINGEEVLEQCADFRAQECIQDDIGGFSQAACRVNRWQDCVVQKEKIDCENTDRRDCLWKEGIKLAPFAKDDKISGSCTPMNPPGLQFWAGDAAKSVCAQGNFVCVVKYEKGLFGGESCKENCDCLSPQWESQRGAVCSSLGDCGPKTNWIGATGYKKGFKIEIGTPEEFETQESTGP